MRPSSKPALGIQVAGSVWPLGALLVSACTASSSAVSSPSTGTGTARRAHTPFGAQTTHLAFAGLADREVHPQALAHQHFFDQSLDNEPGEHR